MNNEHEHPNESDGALLSAIMTLIEILVSTETTKPENIANLFEGQRKDLENNGMFVAAELIEFLRLWTIDPNRQEGRQEILKFLKNPPQGSA